MKRVVVWMVFVALSISGPNLTAHMPAVYAS
jgi:hypothetical protein